MLRQRSCVLIGLLCFTGSQGARSSTEDDDAGNALTQSTLGQTGDPPQGVETPPLSKLPWTSCAPQVTDYLGKGSFGTVWKFQFTTGSSQAGWRAAMKWMKRSVMIEQGMRWQDVKSEFQVQVDAATHTGLVANVLSWNEVRDGDVYALIEYCGGGDLTHLQKEVWPNGIPGDLAKAIFAQLVYALMVLHAHGIVHRDFKPDNVFINNPICSSRRAEDGTAKQWGAYFDMMKGKKKEELAGAGFTQDQYLRWRSSPEYQQWESSVWAQWSKLPPIVDSADTWRLRECAVKIADFGLACKSQAETDEAGKVVGYRTGCGFDEMAGTPAFMAKEILNLRPNVKGTGESTHSKVDIWALGAVLYSMVIGQWNFLDKRYVDEESYSDPPGGGWTWEVSLGLKKFFYMEHSKEQAWKEAKQTLAKMMTARKNRMSALDLWNESPFINGDPKYKDIAAEADERELTSNPLRTVNPVVKCTGTVDPTKGNRQGGSSKGQSQETPGNAQYQDESKTGLRAALSNWLDAIYSRPFNTW